MHVVYIYGQDNDQGEEEGDGKELDGHLEERQELWDSSAHPLTSSSTCGFHAPHKHPNQQTQGLALQIYCKGPGSSQKKYLAAAAAWTRHSSAFCEQHKDLPILGVISGGRAC